MSDAIEIRRIKSAMGSKNEKTKASAVKKRTTKKGTKVVNTGQTKSNAGKRERKIEGGKKRQKKRRLEYPIYRSCLMKFFVNEVFQRLGQEAPHLKPCKKTSKETTLKIKRAVRLLCSGQVENSLTAKEPRCSPLLQSTSNHK